MKYNTTSKVLFIRRTFREYLAKDIIVPEHKRKKKRTHEEAFEISL